MNPASLSVAFKEWAAICQALDEHQQCLVLRKGGIAEEGGTFQVEQPDFLLYPTYFHEHAAGIKADYQDALETAEAERTPPGTIAFRHYARVTDVRYVKELDMALALDPFHGWTADIIRQRFEYRTPGLFVLIVRVHRLNEREYRIEKPEYAGCKSWVTLDVPVPIAGAIPVLTDADFTQQRQQIQQVLQR